MSSQQPQQSQTSQEGGAQKDYGDKAFDFLSKKTGHTFNAETSEKITDGARTVFEKVTGYVIPFLVL